MASSSESLSFSVSDDPMITSSHFTNFHTICVLRTATFLCSVPKCPLKSKVWCSFLFECLKGFPNLLGPPIGITSATHLSTLASDMSFSLPHLSAWQFRASYCSAMNWVFFWLSFYSVRSSPTQAVRTKNLVRGECKSQTSISHRSGWRSGFCNEAVLWASFNSGDALLPGCCCLLCSVN